MAPCIPIAPHAHDDLNPPSKQRRIAAERDLLHHMAEMAEQGDSLGSEIAGCMDTYEMYKYKTNMSTMQVREEVRVMSSCVGMMARGDAFCGALTEQLGCIRWRSCSSWRTT